MKRVGLAHRERPGSVQNHVTPTDSTPRYLLATCSFTPLYGRLCNVLGRKRANQTALFFAGLGVLMCGLSTNMETLIVARFVHLYSFLNVNDLNPSLILLAFRHWWWWLIHYCIVSLQYPLFTTEIDKSFQYHCQ